MQIKIDPAFSDTAFMLVNMVLAFVAVVVAFIGLFVSFQIRNRRVRMGWLIAAVCIALCGLMFQIAGFDMNAERGSIYTVFSRMLYALTAPLFSLYFMETERDEGEEWDGRFWSMIQFLMAVLVSAINIFQANPLLMNIAFLSQYLVVLVMLLFSSKSILESAGFLLGNAFPVFAVFSSMVDSRIDVMGFAIILQLTVVFFCYQLDTDREILQSKAELSEKRVSLLMEQIHPHFIYNSLQQITLLCDEDMEAVKPAILNFSGYLRKKFQALTGESMIPFSEELEHVEMYIDLANILPSRHFEVEKDFEVTDFFLPPLTLQPLVENAIQYGIGMSEEGEKIRIGSRINKGYIELYVSDDGHGKKTRLPTQKSYKSVGTDNVRTRLQLLCEGELSINKSEKGTVATIRIPEMKAKKNK
ncbi:MAG: histidine kinase [Eubacterium sp.]|nr:histidine kinase [Eubacterium sp.]